MCIFDDSTMCYQKFKNQLIKLNDFFTLIVFNAQWNIKNLKSSFLITQC